MSAGLLNETEHHAEPEAGAPPDLLGREERFEHAVEQRRRNAGAGVADRDHHVMAWRDLAVHASVTFVEDDVAGLERKLAAVRHGVARIDGQVEDGGGELVGIDQRRPCVLGEQRRDLDVLAKCRLQQLRRLQHQRIDVDLERLQRLLAGKRQQMPGQIGAAFGGLVDQFGNGD